jgi:glycosyltransferase involved in cell wall biosynthesis
MDKGIEVEILTGKPNYPSGKIFPGFRSLGGQKQIWKGITITRIPMLPRGGGSGWRLALNYLSFIVSGMLFAPWMLRKKKFDIVFVYGVSPILQAIPAIFLGWLKKCPVILWVQDLWPESLLATGYVKNRFVLDQVGKTVKFIYRHVDLLLVQSRAFIKPVEALASGTPIIYYPNSVDDVFTAPASGSISEIPGLGGGFTVFFAGNIGTAQAVEVIVEAASLLKEFSEIQFVVVGDGSRREWMLQEVHRRGLSNLHLPGRFPVEMMPGFMQKASALLVTLADKPIFAATVPNKIQAYMASGKPIIACLNGEGARLVIESNSGLAIPAENAKNLADAILRLYKMDPVERDLLGENGRRYFRHLFDHNFLIDKLIEYFSTVRKKGVR